MAWLELGSERLYDSICRQEEGGSDLVTCGEACARAAIQLVRSRIGPLGRNGVVSHPQQARRGSREGFPRLRGAHGAGERQVTVAPPELIRIIGTLIGRR